MEPEQKAAEEANRVIAEPISTIGNNIGDTLSDIGNLISEKINDKIEEKIEQSEEFDPSKQTETP